MALAVAGQPREACAGDTSPRWVAVPDEATNAWAAAADTNATDGSLVEHVEYYHDQGENWVAAGGGWLDNYLNSWAKYKWSDHQPLPTMRLDAFFSDPSVYYRNNRSRVEVSPQVKIKDGEGVSPSATVGLALDLPVMQNRLSLFFDNMNGRTMRTAPAQNPLPATESDSVIGLLYTLYQSAEFETHAQVGLRRAIYPYVRGSVSYTWDLNPWYIIPSQDIFYYTDKGAGEETGLEVDRMLTSNTLVRSSSGGQWTEDSDGYEFGQSLVLLAMADYAFGSAGYETGGGMNGHASSVTIVDNWSAFFRFRHTIHWDWLFLDVTPQVDFPNDRNYQTVPSITIMLQVVFQKI